MTSDNSQTNRRCKEQVEDARHVGGLEEQDTQYWKVESDHRTAL